MFSLATIIGAALISQPAPNEIIDAGPLMKLVNTSTHGKLFHISQNNIKVDVLHVYGGPKEMGHAQGLLLATTLDEFMNVALPNYYSSIADQLKLKDLPTWLQDRIRNATAAELPAIFDDALEFVYLKEEKYLLEGRAQPLEEVMGIAEGMCESGRIANCSVPKLYKTIRNSNMLPELIRMTCSMMGVWGDARATTGGLTQLRTLDFGGGPFANYSTLIVYHPVSGNSFVNVGFPGIVGAVTGMSTEVSLSEKVWETYDHPSVQPGHYDSLPVVGVIREMLQFSNSKEEAFDLAYTHTRTWAVFLGVGDRRSQQFRAIAYREADLKWYSPSNITEITHFPTIPEIVYIDKHPQPSHDNHTLPGLVNEYRGNMTGAVVARNIPRQEKSGDVHIAVYDWATMELFVSFGVVDSTGNYGPNDEGFACFQPFLRFKFDALISQ
eukprot:TRINITY_DN358_c5_g1_i1.p1 TRINITY_DN358_c5_g1~~TRINITY_DN358_c5_g1_i1.p1  ORF type:complete len:460 (+),score=74.33 TRINITY_DN358_c5_g1_i1:64-1380(+)